jgi:2-polyprenyl-3-methyl-5-hydroxy-6-metoxy-1,4-benzoquinol methylase
MHRYIPYPPSTVWDSSIVVSKYLEMHQEDLILGRKCLDLSAGCGLCALVASRCGAQEVMATDLEENLTLLRENCDSNAPGRIKVSPHTWGSSVEQPGHFDLVCACDLLYITEELVLADLTKSLSSLLAPNGQVVLAFGRNRGGEQIFRVCAEAVFDWEEISFALLHQTYRCSDVKVVCLRLKKKGCDSDSNPVKKRRGVIIDQDQRKDPDPARSMLMSNYS